MTNDQGQWTRDNDPQLDRRIAGIAPMPASVKVLVTGSAGRIGRAVVGELQARGHVVRGFDRAPTPGCRDAVVGDITDPAALQRAAAGMQTLIHLAATPDDDDFLSSLLPNNVVALYHVMESARTAGLSRAILASSGQTVWHLREAGPFPVRTDVVPAPRWWYAATKLLLEAAGQIYSTAHGMQCLAVRLGWCPRTSEQIREIGETPWAPDVYLSPGDAGRFFACAVEAVFAPRYAVVYATSVPARLLRYDLEPAERLLGYVPRDKWPAGIEN